MIKRWIVALCLGVASFGILSVDTAVARNNADFEGAGYWWDGVSIRASYLDASTTEIESCSKELGTTENRNFAPHLEKAANDFFIECLTNNGEAKVPSGGRVEFVENSGREYSSLPQKVNRKFKIAGAPAYPASIEYFCAYRSTPKQVQGATVAESKTVHTFIADGCWALHPPEKKSTSFYYTGIDKHGRATFTGDFSLNGCNPIILLKVRGNQILEEPYLKHRGVAGTCALGTVAQKSESIKTIIGEELFNLREIRGTPGISADQSSTEEAFKVQKADLKKEYKENCFNNSNKDLAQCTTQVDDSFEIIWRACMQSSGDPEADFEAATNCLEKFTGLTFDSTRADRILTPEPEAKTIDDCRVDMLGYVICPVMRFMANAADSMFNVMKTLLHVSPLDPDEPGGVGAYRAWSVLRDIANVIFIIGLLVAITSQITGYGITNYGIKKFLPKLIVAAILVNISFYICLVLVDISNIAGDSLHKVLIDLNKSLPSSGSDVITADMGARSSSIKWGLLIGAGLVASGVVLAIVLMFVPILTAVLLALLTVILLLLTRQAMIIILTVIAPVAFVCYMLPNTKKWFSKWKNYYTTLLMMYPVIAVIFGFSTIAANVILQIGTTADSTTLRLFALAIQAVPLVITPIVMRLGGQALGGAANIIRNNGLTKGIQGRASGFQERAVKRRKLRALKGGKGLVSMMYRRQAKKDAVRKLRKSELQRAQSSYIADFMRGAEGSGGDRSGILQKVWGGVKGKPPRTKSDSYVDSVAAAGGRDARGRVLGEALNVSHKISADEVRSAKASMERVDSSELVQILQDASSADSTAAQSTAQAAAELLAGRDDGDLTAAALSASGSLSPEGREELLATTQKTSMSAFTSNPTTAQSIRSGRVNAGNYGKTVIAPSFEQGTMSPAAFGGLDTGALQRVAQAHASGQLTSTGTANLNAVAGETLRNSKINLEQGERQIIQQIYNATR